MSERQYDYILAGGGAAGCVLAARLTENPDTTVLLIEAGPDYGPNPDAWPEETLDPSVLWEDSHPWGYHNAPGAGGFELHLPRGKVMGGSSTINGCVWLRGSQIDYDNWAAAGNPGWSFDDLLPAFQKVESDSLASGSNLHGVDGPVPVWRVPDAEMTPIERVIFTTADELNFDRLEDLNGSRTQRPGIGKTPKNIDGNVRMNGAFTYLAAARHRDNLTIMADTLIDKVTFDDAQATGLRTADGREFRGREIILTAGAYGSPAILLRSGIGPANHLQEIGIRLRHELPGVGQNLMDHPSVNGVNRFYVLNETDAPGEPGTIVFARPLIVARSSQVDSEIDLHLYPLQLYNRDAEAWLFRLTPSLQYSRSKGHVRLTSLDPAATLDIDHCYFSEPADLEALCDGVELSALVTSTPPLSEHLTPVPDHQYEWSGREQLCEFVRARVATSYHPSSTCRMGPASDPLNVVDPQGRVHGLANLRVIDASIFPHGPRCNLHFPTIAVAEHLAGELGDR